MADIKSEREYSEVNAVVKSGLADRRTSFVTSLSVVHEVKLPDMWCTCVTRDANEHNALFDHYGPLGLLINTPSHHRVHHGRNPYCVDRNYGGVFIVWDKLFNTFEAERKDDPPIYGLIKRENTFNQLWLQFHVLKELLTDKWRTKDEKGQSIFKGIEKIKAVFYPPAYLPGTQVRHFFHWWSLADSSEGVPEVEKVVIKYNPPLERWLKWYCFVHFVILLAVFFHFEYDRIELSSLQFLIKIVFFVFTMQCLSAFFDLKSHAPYMELLRCSTVIVYYFYLMTDNVGAGPNRLFMLVYFASSAALWSGFCVHKAHEKRRIATASMKGQNVGAAESTNPKIQIISNNISLAYPTGQKLSHVK
ncbi:Alkylglycerol monooxygenase -like protein [Toxocara canis]|uniref:Alkylglycerol monooxygenase n=1 Tax=Toxocara canis TaxID=6265 RepID=A0A0B2UZE1_TOXCA|nr:Alkylglycerol monooxygenase -like protein [Toxocara canis]